MEGSCVSRDHTCHQKTGQCLLQSTAYECKTELLLDGPHSLAGCLLKEAIELYVSLEAQISSFKDSRTVVKSKTLKITRLNSLTLCERAAF